MVKARVTNGVDREPDLPWLLFQEQSDFTVGGGDCQPFVHGSGPRPWEWSPSEPLTGVHPDAYPLV